jgi:maleate isomerase
MSQYIENLPFSTDGGAGGAARCALVTLATDHTIEHEFRFLVGRPDVGLYHTRLWNDAAVTIGSLKAIEERITPAVELVLPGEDIDVVAFGCTSATIAIGEGRIGELIRRAKPKAEVTTPLSAACVALRTVGAERLAILTPYVREINMGLKDYFEKAGFSVPVLASFNEPNDRTVARITPESIVEAASRAVRTESVDALFVSCTSLRMLEVVDVIEQANDVFVTSSNHAMAWHMLRLANMHASAVRPGRLFKNFI